MFVAQAASACHWNWTAMGDGQRPTEGDSRLRGTREPVHQASGFQTGVHGPKRVRDGFPWGPREDSDKYDTIRYEMLF